MANNVATFFTYKSVERLLREGGTSAWRIDRNHARDCQFAVCTRNSKHPKVEGNEPHQAAFMVGTIKDVVPVPDRNGRFLVQFKEYALVNVPDVWKGDRNPVRYAESLEELGIDPAALHWKPMPDQAPAPTAAPPPVSAWRPIPLTISEAKLGLSLSFGVPPEAIGITIRA